MSEDRLDELRRRIDELNRRLLADLNERLKLVDEVRELKLQRGLPMHDPAREEQMLNDLKAENPGPLTDLQLTEAFRAIFQLMLSHMERCARGRST